MADRQLAFDLGHRPALGREDFLVAPSNEIAVAWIDRWPDWPGPTLALHGPPGSGKTHLCEVWRALSGAVAMSPGALAAQEPPEFLGGARAAVLDGLQDALAGDPGLEVRVLHLHNLLAEAGGYLLVTGTAAPARWRCRLADLASRLAAAPAVGLEPPDDALIAALLVKLFADRQLRVEPDVVRYLATRLERSFEAARAAVARLDRLSLSTRRAVTVPLARQALAEAGISGLDPQS